MPRNAAGVYTLPTGNPVIPGALISSTWANTTLSDIATALTNSLSVDKSVTTSKLNDGAVTTIKIADDAVTAAKLADDAVTGDKIADDAIGAQNLLDDSSEAPMDQKGVQLVLVMKDSPTGSAEIPVGTTAERTATPSNGMLRYNSEKNQFEGYQNGQWGQVGGGDPLFSVMWWPQRSAIPAGYVAADGQTLSRTTYPDAWEGIDAGNVPTVAEAIWNSTPTERGKFTAGDGSTTFRLPDYNGKSAGSLGAVFLRGDGALSAAVAGAIQQDALQGHLHSPPGGAVGYVAAINGGYGLPAGASVTYAVSATGPATTDGTNGTPRTARETRPLNVTGCWVIKLFGTVVNVGSADAAQLASDYANLAGRVSTAESQIDFTIIYPNGGSAASPANVTTGTRYVLTNPFEGFHVVAIAQYMLSGNWTDVMMTFYGGGTHGGSCGQVGGDIVLLTGSGALDGTSSIIGSLSNNVGTAVYTAPCRIKVWKIKGIIA